MTASVPALGPASPLSVRRAVLADRLAVRTNPLARDLTLVVAVAAFTALAAQVSFHIPGTPVPVTGQTFAVLLSAAAVGPARGVAGQLLYVALGWVGLPVFAGGHHGWSEIAGPNGGYLVGFVLASLLIGWHARRGLDRKPDTLAASFLLATALIYLPGVAWLAHEAHVSYAKAMTLGVYPFVLGDVVKAALAGVLLPSAWRLLGDRRIGADSTPV